MSRLTFPAPEADLLEPHLPIHDISSSPVSSSRPFVTLTFATSLDSALSLGPGIRTALSGPQSKAMTHYLRSRHDAICIGVGTAIADDPGLNCRLDAASRRGPGTSEKAQHPRPIIIDPRLRWDFSRDNKIFQLVRGGDGLAPFIITAVTNPSAEKVKILEDHGGKFIVLNSSPASTLSSATIPSTSDTLDWLAILAAVRQQGLHSIMIEGGGTVINSLLASQNKTLVDSVIITIAPTWLGKGSVVVSPEQEVEKRTGQRALGPRLTGVRWIPLGEDVVVCGRLQ
ncbi:putative riboflavin biosynthesis protein Rib7 [Microdochium trichocladiopsis]|uniref:2,5-diamino-6-ribosylamino-4(3H)-pyrimidinone 5'-phosphate reductase n=1 Tax=Microdochium trichocladiopsis TaxID=1682393 RepID=A0A9P9BQH8_9PEZI|nr:putative riboflavin biosynthesis protein Rib7 [Microdochium trichocladiopsis]KAH7030888.1 putative riboflavin biosynthesis protein Rib7 [Microdochium trichocladiopsis]